MLNNKGPSIDPCGTSAVIFLQSPRILFIYRIGRDLWSNSLKILKFVDLPKTSNPKYFENETLFVLLSIKIHPLYTTVNDIVYQKILSNEVTF